MQGRLLVLFCVALVASGCSRQERQPSQQSTECARGELRCGENCIDASSDPEHCGLCDRRCDEGSQCVDSRCVEPEGCTEPLVDCEGTCTDLLGDPANCGRCGESCPAEMICHKGECILDCPADTSPCDGSCVSTDDDSEHCGACGNACPEGLTCSGGSCVRDCGEDARDCDGVCIDVRSSRAHCGACGVICDDVENASVECQNGRCVFSCDVGFADCDDDPDNGCESNVYFDSRHCGSCGRTCASGEYCSSGLCYPYCSGGLSWCGESCVDTFSTPEHCGECDRSCDAGRSCITGVCTCPMGLTDCSGDCVDTSEDTSHCGSCGEACDPGDTCSGGVCITPCSEGLTACDGACVDLQSDEENCGACGFVCAELPGVESGTCSAGSCTLVCQPGFENCDGDPRNGCETDTGSDPKHCGACGTPCSTTCQNGECMDLVIAANLGGWGHSCAIDRSGDMHCWGRNHLAQLGAGYQDSGSVRNPLPIFIVGGVLQPALGEGHGCALMSDGTVTCWGYNGNGRVGTGGRDMPGQPVENQTPTQVPGISGALQVAVGINHSCALLSGGSVRCWGDNAKGQLGDGSTTQRLLPVDVKDASNQALTGVVRIGAGGTHTCALLDTGNVVCWGDNANGQLGRGSLAVESDPHWAPIAGISGLRDLSVGRNHACAVSQVGDAYCWGNNDYRQIGNGNTSSPIDAPSHVALNDVVSISAGVQHTCAVLQDGTARCWGRNTGSNVSGGGQLGNGTRTDSPTPVVVQGLEQVSLISAGGYHTCAVNDGSFYCWGSNDYGQLGDGSPTRKDVPSLVQGIP